MDELLDEGFALGRGATLEDVVDVIGQRVEFVARGHRGRLVEQSDQFVAAGLQLFRLGPECRQPVLQQGGVEGAVLERGQVAVDRGAGATFTANRR